MNSDTPNAAIPRGDGLRESERNGANTGHVSPGLLSARCESWLACHGASIVIALGLLGCLIGIFDRSIAFHDEIINTDKALEGVILDYAMRPVFFALNIVGMHIFGNHAYSLVLLSVVSLTLSCFVLFQIASRYLCASTSLLCVVAFVGVNMVRAWGVRAMAHGHAGLFMLLSLYCALSCFDAADAKSKQRAMGFAAGFLAMVSFSTHPTLAAYLVALCSWAGLTWLLHLVGGDRFLAYARPLRPTLWIALGVLAGIATLALVYATWYHQSYFIAWWNFAHIPQGSEATRGYSLWYLWTMLWWGLLPSVFLLASVAIVGVRAATSPAPRQRSAFAGQRSFAAAMVLYCLLVTLGMVSLNQWKHGRILLSFLPLLALSFAFYFDAACGVLRAWLPGRASKALVFLSVVLILTGSVTSTVLQISKTSRQSESRRRAYLSLYEALRNVKDSAIGVLAQEGPLGTMEAFPIGAGLKTVRLATSEELAASGPGGLVRDLEDKGVRYVFWNIEELPAPQYESLTQSFRQAGGSLLLNWQGRRELWFVGGSQGTAKVL